MLWFRINASVKEMMSHRGTLRALHKRGMTPRRRNPINHGLIMA
jgi:hypothetical protein